MIAMIQKIISNGHAYALPDGDVYFEVATLPGYGALSGRQQEDNRWGGGRREDRGGGRSRGSSVPGF
jgi:cysteinyl-tRNA synthetase